MTSKRSCRDRLSQQKVREELVKGIGTQFDPEYAAIMSGLIDPDKDYQMKEEPETDDPAYRICPPDLPASEILQMFQYR